MQAVLCPLSPVSCLLCPVSCVLCPPCFCGEYLFLQMAEQLQISFPGGAIPGDGGFGERIGRGSTVEQARTDIGQVVEGVATTLTVGELARRHEVAVPVCREVERVLFEGKDARAAIDGLMLRELKSE